MFVEESTAIIANQQPIKLTTYSFDKNTLCTNFVDDIVSKYLNHYSWEIWI